MKRYEVRISNGGTYVDASYAGGIRGRESALTDAAFYTAKRAPKLMPKMGMGDLVGVKVSVVEVTARGSFTIIAWSAMWDPKYGPLVWVLERATGMAVGECDSLGIDWEGERDRRLALGGEW